MTDYCPECGSDNLTAEDAESENYGDSASSWTEYRCKDCKCRFRIGWRSEEFVEISESGIEDEE